MDDRGSIERVNPGLVGQDGLCNGSGKKALQRELRVEAAVEFSQQEYGLKINGSVL